MNEKRGLLIKRTTMMLVGILFISICVGCYRAGSASMPSPA